VPKYDAVLKKIISPSLHHPLYLGLSLIFLFLFLVIAFLVNQNFFLEYDTTIRTHFLPITNLSFWNAITILGNPLFILTLAGITSFVLWRHGHITRLLFLLLAIGGGGFLGYFFKATILSTRPSDGQWLDGLNSFPSGHTVVAFTAYLGALLTWHHRIKLFGVFQKFSLHVIAILIMILLPLSRLAIDVHWASDVLGGILLGIGWTLFVFAWYDFRWS